MSVRNIHLNCELSIMNQYFEISIDIFCSDKKRDFLKLSLFSQTFNQLIFRSAQKHLDNVKYAPRFTLRMLYKDRLKER